MSILISRLLPHLSITCYSIQQVWIYCINIKLNGLITVKTNISYGNYHLEKRESLFNHDEDNEKTVEKKENISRLGHQ